MLRSRTQLVKGHFPLGGIFRAERHFLLFKDQLAESRRQKTKENIIPRGKFRLVENGPKSHGDDLGLEYLRNGAEYDSLENSLQAMEKKAEYGGQPEILTLVHVIERSITVHYEDLDKGLYLENFLLIVPA